VRSDNVQIRALVTGATATCAGDRGHHSTGPALVSGEVNTVTLPPTNPEASVASRGTSLLHIIISLAIIEAVEPV